MSSKIKDYSYQERFLEFAESTVRNNATMNNYNTNFTLFGNVSSRITNRQIYIVYLKSFDKNAALNEMI